MRFRTTTDWTALLVIFYAVAQTFLTGGRIMQHLAEHRRVFAGFESALVLFLIAVAIRATMTLFRSYLVLTETSIRLHPGVWSKDISYNSIVGVRATLAKDGKPGLRSIELEIAKLDPPVYPHEYVVLKVADRDSFARELSARTPKAVHEF